MAWGILPKADVASGDIEQATERPSNRVTVQRAFSALALGALLGGVGVLCSQWTSHLDLACVALQSAFSMMVLGITSSARSMDLTLDVQWLDTCPESGDSRPREGRDLCGQRMDIQLGFAAS